MFLPAQKAVILRSAAPDGPQTLARQLRGTAARDPRRCWTMVTLQSMTVSAIESRESSR